MRDQRDDDEQVKFPLWFEVSVWNCQAELVCYHEDETGRRTYYRIHAPKQVMDRIQELAEQSVYAAGGALNISGIYPLSDELADYLWARLKQGMIFIVPEQEKSQHGKGR